MFGWKKKYDQLEEELGRKTKQLLDNKEKHNEELATLIKKYETLTEIYLEEQDEEESLEEELRKRTRQLQDNKADYDKERTLYIKNHERLIEINNRELETSREIRKNLYLSLKDEQEIVERLRKAQEAKCETCNYKLCYGDNLVPINQEFIDKVVEDIGRA